MGGKWYDLDATLTNDHSVGHVLLGTSALTDADGHVNEMELVSTSRWMSLPSSDPLFQLPVS